MSVYSMLVEDNVRCMGIIRGKPLAGIYIKGGGGWLTGVVSCSSSQQGGHADPAPLRRL